MKNAPVPIGMVTAFLLGIVVKKECIVNAFNILSTLLRRTNHVLPLVESIKNVDFQGTNRGQKIQFNKKGRHPIGMPPSFRGNQFRNVNYCITVTRLTVTPVSV